MLQNVLAISSRNENTLSAVTSFPYPRDVIPPCQGISLGFARTRLNFRPLEHVAAGWFQRAPETRSVPPSRYGFRQGINIDTRFSTSRHFPASASHGRWICGNPPFYSTFAPFQIPISPRLDILFHLLQSNHRLRFT